MTRTKMPRINRASQFAPYDALKGLQEALRIAEYENEKIVKGELSEDEASHISNILLKLEKNSVVKVNYFFNGHDMEYVGKIKIDINNQTMQLGNQTLPLNNLRKIDFV